MVGHHFGIGQCAVTFGCILRGGPNRDMGLQATIAGRACLGRRDSAVNIGGIMPVTVKHIPTRSGEARTLIDTAGHIDCAIDGDVIVIPQHNQAAEFVATRKPMASYGDPPSGSRHPAMQ